VTYKIPVTPGIAQTFTCTLTQGLTLWFRLYWVEAPEAGWAMDIGRSSTEPIVCGIPLLPGQDLLAQYPELEIPVVLYINTPGFPERVPAFDELGVSTFLLYEVNA
jgi:hypothetical protein